LWSDITLLTEHSFQECH